MYWLPSELDSTKSVHGLARHLRFTSLLDLRRCFEIQLSAFARRCDMRLIMAM